MNDQPTPSTSENPAANFLPRQSFVYQKYLALPAILTRHPGALLEGTLGVCVGLERDGAELAIAATLAGAAFLGIDPNPQTLKLSQQHHACDFVVNTLDEALRVLKNAIRKRQPIAVGLLGDAAEILPRMVERGVQPDFLSDTTHLDASAAIQSAKASLAQRGSLLLNFGPELEAVELPRETLRWVGWTSTGFQDMQRMDALALSHLPATDAARRRWLQGASAYFYRQIPLERVCALSLEEITALQSALEDPAWRASLRSPITLAWQDAARNPQTRCVEPR
ncbi:MAG TPA: hypothetical protein VMU62_02995 [Acidobacteriaceae bacterium]|nr:hypothetical protein [Acidobacteriaceae bacterium]